MKSNPSRFSTYCVDSFPLLCQQDTNTHVCLLTPPDIDHCSDIGHCHIHLHYTPLSYKTEKNCNIYMSTLAYPQLQLSGTFVMKIRNTRKFSGTTLLWWLPRNIKRAQVSAAMNKILL